ncbi:uncharacterized protein GGS22DRAFT_159678 [Annulohypoxylon maeteangense]|uniref:uncharacterized protein n=1 Tax=Annulohypoxylon maeteangense TaxID=1927788 RepID=UPI002007B4DF|nr:uncharacterized protein GGS22DRAFT_159678 [Annulohypoxylon maeteangense]KAI0886043.1 hypothetical protein GGS22DRAFT_159678 [Annulohypoxylon maeteangense]
MPLKVCNVSISCLCSTAKQIVTLRFPSKQTTTGQLDINFCHCYACRHSSGLLCVSYAPIQPPQSTNGIVTYLDETANVRRYFCGTCGCHIFKREQGSSRDAVGADGLWAVATGTIIGRAGTEEGADWDPEVADGGKGYSILKFAGHVNVAGTKDGGLSPFIQNISEPREPEICGHHNEVPPPPSVSVPGEGKNAGRSDEDVLEAHCHCETVRFRITRPDASSRVPHSGFPDLTVPFATSPPELISNPDDEKWWLRPPDSPNPTMYLAGLCACRSCRLTSGFEAQTWTFVPRSNIFFLPPSHSSSPHAAIENTLIPLDFSALPKGILQSYESSPGVLREFCPRCGATVFWHDRWRPGIVDVSTGLLDAPEGARAESWLDWWYSRVSFAEDAGNGRVGEAAQWAENVVDSFSKGLKLWEENGGKGVA